MQSDDAHGPENSRKRATVQEDRDEITAVSARVVNEAAPPRKLHNKILQDNNKTLSQTNQNRMSELRNPNTKKKTNPNSKSRKSLVPYLKHCYIGEKKLNPQFEMKKGKSNEIEHDWEMEGEKENEIRKEITFWR